MISFDANVSIYAADRDGGTRQLQALEWLERAMRSGNCVQTLPSLAEFYSVLIRKMGAAPDRARVLSLRGARFSLSRRRH